MQTPEVLPYVPDTRVKLLVDAKGDKEIDGQWVDHPLPAGTIVSITKHKAVNRRSSTNTSPVSAEDFAYKLYTYLVENIPKEKLEGPYTGHNDAQKISHTALDTDRCSPRGPHGTYQMGQQTYICRGRQYTYRVGSQTVTLKGGDLIEIAAPGTTKSASPLGSSSVLIANNAYYLKVKKVKRSTEPTQIEWRSKFVVPGDKFEVV